ncbi:uncharacterized protein LOC115319206 isoform X1 [Ixodes scapularis]|uniref:uncharacterized protein LOC115319206 isoform X1 n=1 Tax=Ixodes scapularis TaxID=6945 RepID=UPI001A9DF067|nr:uncharacterized protein LOC115319206 isoform X1 [Ixodes scapularis]
MSAGVDREPPEPPNTSRTSPRTPRTGGIHKGLNHARIVSKHGSLTRRLPPHARRKQEARSLNVKFSEEVRRAGPHFFKAAAEHYEPRITAAADSRGCCAAPCTAHGSKHTSGDQCMPLMHRRGPGDHGIDELAFALSKVAAEHYGQARSHRTGWLTGVVLYSARHCVWLNRPSRGSLHDLYEASLAIVSNRPDSWAKPFKTALLGPVLFGGSDLAIFPSRGFLLYLNKLSYFFLMVVHTFCHTSQKQCGESMPQITVKRAGRVNSEKVYGKKIDIPH